MVIYIKALFLDDIRRFQVEPSFDQLAEKLKGIFGHASLTLKYTDDENDLVTLACQDDLDEALSNTKKRDGGNFLRLTVSVPPADKPALPSHQNEAESDSAATARVFVVGGSWRGRHGHGQGNDKPWIPPFRHACGNQHSTPRKALARFVAHVTIPDGSSIEPNASFTKTWRVRNDGPRPWPAGSSLTFVSKDAGESFGASESQAVTELLAPGSELEITVPMVAPTAPGLYQGYWRFMGPHGGLFGQRLGCTVLVADPDEPAAAPPSPKLDQWLEPRASKDASPQLAAELTQRANKIAHKLARITERVAKRHPSGDYPDHAKQRMAKLAANAEKVRALADAVGEQLALLSASEDDGEPCELAFELAKQKEEKKNKEKTDEEDLLHEGDTDDDFELVENKKGNQMTKPAASSSAPAAAVSDADDAAKGLASLLAVGIDEAAARAALSAAGGNPAIAASRFFAAQSK